MKRKPFGRWGRARKKRAVQAPQGEEIEMEMVQEVFYGSDHGDHEEIEIEMEVFHDNDNEHDDDGEEAVAFTLALWLWCLTRIAACRRNQNITTSSLTVPVATRIAQRSVP